MRGQAGFFDIDERLKELSAKGDDLDRLNAIVDFEAFRPDLAKAVPRSDGSKGGRPPFDHVFMFKILILQASHSLSDERAEFLIKDRLSFMRFLGLGLSDAVPDANTIWTFREALTGATIGARPAIEVLFGAYDTALRKAGFLAMGGQIVDATIVAAPKQIPWAGGLRPALCQSEVAERTTLEANMEVETDRPETSTAIRSELGAMFVSLELSRSSWLITSLSPGNGETLSKHAVPSGDTPGLLTRFAQLREKAQARTGRCFPIIVIQEAGLDGFWLHRALQAEGIESHVVDPASIAVSRRRRRAKTDRLDGETLVRALLAYKRGEPRVCAMVKAPSPEEEDHRRITRERKVLTNERVQHINRIKGLLFAQGISGYEPLRRDRRERLNMLMTGDGRLLPEHLKAQIGRELDRLELLLEQLKAVEVERDMQLAAARSAATPAAAATLLHVKGIGPEFAAVLWSEGLFRHFDNRRQVASYAGLAPTPWQSGAVDREQGVSKAGNPRLRTTMIQLAWLWLGHQPHSAVTRWFRERVERNGGRVRKTMIVALARKLLVALWKYVSAGIVIEGAVMKGA